MINTYYFIRIFFLVFLANFCATDISLKTIFARSKEALASNNTENVEKVLMDHYFTQNKEDSIWLYAYRSTFQLFDLKLEQDAITRMEIAIKKIYRRYVLCNHLKEEKSRCFGDFVRILDEQRRDFLWKLTGIGARKGMSQNGAYYIAYAAMSLLISDISASVINDLEEFEESKQMTKQFMSVVAKSKDFLHDYKDRVAQWRVDQVNAVVICEMSLIFWKEFTGVCETRWRRDLSGLAQENALHYDLAFHNDSNFDVEIERHKRSDFQYPELDIVDQLGGKTNSFHKLFRAKVFDKTAKKVYFEEEIIIGESDRRGVKLQKLFERGIKKRYEIETGIRQEIERYVDETWGVVDEMMEMFYNRYHQ